MSVEYAPMKRLIAALVLAITAVRAEADPYAVLEAMGTAADGVRDYAMTLRRQEWGRDAMGPEEVVAVRWAAGEKFRFEILRGDGAGRRVAFRRGWNGGRLRVRLATWPHPRLNLEPCGKPALEGIHRPVEQSSLLYLVRSVRANVARGRERGEGRPALLGEETLFGRRCLKIEFAGPVRTRSIHVVKEGETLETIGADFGVSVRTLLHANRARGYASCDAVRPGDRVEVPRYDASMVRLWVDERSHLPLRVLLWDDDGVLFERFEHEGLQVNVGLTDADFEP